MREYLLSSFLCSRLCHDLAGPIGAASNSIELIAGETHKSTREEAINLAEISTKQAVQKLRFYRLAFGFASDGLTVEMARDIAIPAIQNQRLSLEWPEKAFPKRLLPNMVRLVLNIILVAKDTLAQGGIISIGQGTKSPFRVSASGEKIYIVENLVDSLCCEIDESSFSPKLAPNLLAGYLAAAQNLRICIENKKNELIFFVNEI